MPGGWFYNDVSGVVRYDSGPAYYADLLARALGTGWNGPYSSEALAFAHKGVVGPAPTTDTNPLHVLPRAAGAAAQGAASNILGLPHFTGAALRTFALRALKVVLGIGLVIVGVIQLTHAQTAIATVAKVVP